jgi:hypothetical protein
MQGIEQIGEKERQRESELGREGDSNSRESKWRGLILTVGLNRLFN